MSSVLALITWNFLFVTLPVQCQQVNWQCPLSLRVCVSLSLSKFKLHAPSIVTTMWVVKKKQKKHMYTHMKLLTIALDKTEQ